MSEARGSALGGTEHICGSATDEEVLDAVAALTSEEKRRLYYFAKRRLELAGRGAAGWTPDDLLQEVITKTLERDRKWYKKQVDFVGHLQGAIQSISSDMVRKLATVKHEEPFSASELESGEDDDGVSSQFECAASTPSRLLEATAAKELLVMVSKLFQDDREVLDLIEAICGGLTGNETCEMLGLSQNAYSAARRRLSRGLVVAFPGGIDYEG